MLKPIFKLKVRRIGPPHSAVCDFELAWGQGQTLSAELEYPPILSSLYQEWQEVYLGYYNQLRAQVKYQGVVNEMRVDLRSQLVHAEAALLDQFHSWLRQPALHGIRAQLADTAQTLKSSGYSWVDLFLNCTPLDLARLPWETWEIGSDLGGTNNIRIARQPLNVRHAPVRPIRRKARVLVIFGDDQGLDLTKDAAATQQLARTAHITEVRWQTGKDAAQMKQEVCDAIANPQGWDMLLFAGHSGETQLTGGQLAIAPQVGIHLSELETPLQKAQQQGLQFALFNSCQGLSIAQSLVELGLSQVIVMREPIHDWVAQDFLTQFLASMAAHRDVHESLQVASDYLKEQKQRLEYPSAYLVPSVFRHPQAAVFRIEPFGWQKLRQQWQPTKRDRCWIAAFLLLSLIPPVQDLLLEPRLWGQAVYREWTGQVPAPEKPPVLMVEIDEKSLKADGVKLVYDRYMDYGYIAKLVDELTERQAQIIGIDYLLDRDEAQPEAAEKLQESIVRAVDRQTWLIFSALERKGEGVSPALANLDHSMQGDAELSYWYTELLPEGQTCEKRCPFGYLLALSQMLRRQQEQLPEELQYPKKSQKSFRIAVNNLSIPLDEHSKRVKNSHWNSVASLSREFEQNWFLPIIDFSIPDRQVMDRISACQLLSSCAGKEKAAKNIQDQVVIIAHGRYWQAGLLEPGDDQYDRPLALQVGQEGQEIQGFTGAEAHAYMIHHLLNQRLVLPVPDFLIILVAALCGKGMTLILKANPERRRAWVWGWGGGSVAYLLASWQIFISGAVLFPVVLPLGLFWRYVCSVHSNVMFREGG